MNRWTFASLLMLSVAGCSPRRDAQSGVPAQTQTASLGKTDDETVVLIALDLSGSFRDRIAGRGEGYEFATRVIDRYFRGRIGTQDKLVIAQISGTDRSLLWEGTPLMLQRQFPTADAFRDYLLSKADPNGSHVFKGLSHAIRYVLSDSRVESGKAKTAVFVLSDMLDNGPDSESEEKYLNHEMAELGWRGALIGMYWVDQDQTLIWRQKLRQFGVKNCRVESEIVGQPPLPSFD